MVPHPRVASWLLWLWLLGGAQHDLLSAAEHTEAQPTQPTMNTTSPDIGNSSADLSLDVVRDPNDDTNSTASPIVQHALDGIHPMHGPRGTESRCSVPEPTLAQCTMVTYPSSAPNASDADALAQSFVASLRQVLSTYTCEQQGGLWSCDDCIDAYARWACGYAFPPCDPAERCHRACHDVMRKCPQGINFACPTQFIPPRSRWARPRTADADTDTDVCSHLMRAR